MRREKVAAFFRHGIYNQYEIARRLLPTQDPEQPDPGYERKLHTMRVIVSKDLKWIRAQWRETAVANFQEGINQQVETLRDLYRDVKEQWERSKTDEVVKEKEFSRVKVKDEVSALCELCKGSGKDSEGQCPVCNGLGKVVREPAETATVLRGKKIKRRNKYGDPALYAQMLATQDKICQLLGLYPGKEQTLILRGDADNPVKVEHSGKIDLESFKKLSLDEKVAFMRQQAAGSKS